MVHEHVYMNISPHPNYRACYGPVSVGSISFFHYNDTAFLQVHRRYFCYVCSKNVGCLLGVACYVLWSFGLTVFHSPR